jgi:hypothetical protein
VPDVNASGTQNGFWPTLVIILTKPGLHWQFDAPGAVVVCVVMSQEKVPLGQMLAFILLQSAEAPA